MDIVHRQEFLQGKEYVVDCVTRDGVHTTTFVWVYDKREANGGGFVYFGARASPYPPSSPPCPATQPQAAPP